MNLYNEPYYLVSVDSLQNTDDENTYAGKEE